MVTKLLKFFQKKRTIEERVKQIQAGDNQEKNKLIQEYIPFIQKTASQQLGRYIEVENDDVYSISLMAFNEAIDKYVMEKGSFLSFASMVIKSRIIDQLRKEAKSSSEIFISTLENSDDGDCIANIATVDSFENRIEAKEDMELLLKRMAIFKVTLDDLVNESPKHLDTRLMAIRIGRYVYENQDLKEKLIKTQSLPANDLILQMQVSKKILQRSRKFIIAIVLILDSNLETLKYYISQIERRG